jgi:large subunit ribosomal protein L21
MTYAIIELAGRQFMVKEGDVLEVTRQDDPVCKTLFYKHDGETVVGTPYVYNILVDLEKLADKKDTKVMVARYKAKSRYRRTKGHRQPVSVLKVKSIGLSAAPKSVTAPKKPEDN